MSFDVRILPADTVIQAAPGEAVLAAALRQGFSFPYSCRNGDCGACMGRLLQGRVDYPQGRPLVLSAADEAAGQAVFCQAAARSDLLIEVQEVVQTRAQVVRTLPARVERVDDLAADVKRLWLRLPPTETLQFLPGQYVDILLRDGRRRSFSLANPPSAQALLELHVRHCPGGRFTGHVFQALRVRDLLRLEGPLGTFFLREPPPPRLLLMGGGTGFAPLKSIVEHLLEQDPQRPLHLFWGARRRTDLYLHELAAGWAREHPRIEYTPVLSHAADDAGWAGERGWVHEALLRHYPDLHGSAVYMSGPPAMINAARAVLPGAGLAHEDLHYDAFDYAADSHHAGVRPD